MKKILIIIIALSSFYLYGQSREITRYTKLAKNYCSQRYYYTCLGLMIRLKKLKYQDNEYIARNIEAIIDQNDDEIFDQLQTLDLVRFQSPALYPLIGKRLLEQNEFEKAIRVLSLIPENHKAYALGLHYKGVAYHMLGDPVQALELYKDCVKRSRRYSKSGNAVQRKRYSINGDSCRSNIARTFYREKKYKKAIDLWNKIDRKSHVWPMTLIEKAWAHYYLKDYNRALGLLVTYKSPLLESYFIPEAEILKGLSYYRMCIYEDTDNVIKRFSKIYQPKSSKLKSILSQHKNSNIYFFNLAIKSFHKLPKKSFVRKLAISLFKNPRYERMLNSYRQALGELKKLRSSNMRNKAIEGYVKKSGFFIRRSINDYIKRNFFSFINQMHFYSNELFKVNLEIFRQKKNIVKRNFTLDKTERKRGSLKNVRRRSDQYFWKFYGGFWADELGGYSFGLKNQCEALKKKGAKS